MATTGCIFSCSLAILRKSWLIWEGFFIFWLYSSSHMPHGSQTSGFSGTTYGFCLSTILLYSSYVMFYFMCDSTCSRKEQILIADPCDSELLLFFWVCATVPFAVRWNHVYSFWIGPSIQSTILGPIYSSNGTLLWAAAPLYYLFDDALAGAGYAGRAYA